MARVDQSTGTLEQAPVVSHAVSGDDREPAASGFGSGSTITVSLFDFVQKLVRGRRLLLWSTLIGLALGVGYFFLVPSYFVAEASFLPPQQQQQSALGVLGALFQNQSQADSTDTYLGLLASRSVTDDVVDQTHVMEHFKTHSRLSARNTVTAMSKFAVSKNQLITVTVKDPDPGYAALVANAFLEALYRQNGLMVTSASSHREQFFRQQLQQQKEELAEAETNLRVTQEKTGMVTPEGEAAAGISATAQLQQQINLAETKLSGLLAGATEQNPQVIEARQELASLRSALGRQQAATSVRRPGGGLASTSELPALTMENLRRQRELKLQETLYTTLTEQYEHARLGSVDPGPQLQIVDRAVRPERKGGPHARYFIGGGALIGFAGAFSWLLFAAPLRRVYRAYKRHSSARAVQA